MLTFNYPDYVCAKMFFKFLSHISIPVAFLKKHYVLDIPQNNGFHHQQFQQMHSTHS